jgi:pimeloyl-ACP methyl ester carboxylesterase
VPELSQAKPATRRIVIAASHGILAGLTDPGWVDAFERWVVTKAEGKRLKAEGDGVSLAVITNTYVAGPVPALNYFFLNPILARWLANGLKRWADDGYTICMVGHSNGTDVNLRAAKLLAHAGYKIDTMILIGSVVEPDLERSGLLNLLEAGYLRRAVAYCSVDDHVLGTLPIWPYRDLGRKGFQSFGDSVDAFPAFYAGQAENRWFQGGHCGYFERGQQERTFELIASDLGLTQRREDAKGSSTLLSASREGA